MVGNAEQPSAPTTPAGGERDALVLNRELSWLDFNARVLDLARDDRLAVLERLKFVAIFSTNLDEFFQVRAAALHDQIAAGIDKPTWDGRTPLEQLVEITERVPDMVADQESLYHDLVGVLADSVVEIRSYESLSAEQAKAVEEYYHDRIFPVLTPLSVDPGHPFPYISNLALSIAATVYDPDNEESRFVRLKVPDVFPRLIEFEPNKFVLAEDVIGAHLDTLFVGMQVQEWATFRVTRNADLTLEEEEADDLLEAVELELRRRRFNKAVRLEISEGMSEQMCDMLVRELAIHPNNVVRCFAPLDLSMLWQLQGIDRPDLKDQAWPPVTAGRLLLAEETERPIFSVIRDRPILVHHPYESFASSVVEFIDQAAVDPAVQSIKMTLYRAGTDNPIISALIRAAERGKPVAVLVELKARFDEATNVEFARRLERAGVHVVYGVIGLKTHSKVVLVVRDDGDRLRRYCHIATGNYNGKTARIYEDLGYFTCDDDIGNDVSELFNHLTGYSRSIGYRRLLVAPESLRPRLVDLIANEASFGSEGRITIKCNAIADLGIAEALYAASDAGVQIDGIVRGICTMRSGVPGLSDNIRVRSILGRYLEHSRIYRFAHGGPNQEPTYLIGSADLMPRNLDRRVEVLVPIDHPRHREWLDQVFAFHLSDEVARWELQPDDSWQRVGTGSDVADAQALMYDYTVERQAQRATRT